MNIINFASKNILLCLIIIINCSLNSLAYPINATIEDVQFSESGNITDMIVTEISQANDSLDVMIFIFNYKPIADAIIDAQKRGVNTRVLVDFRSFEKMESMEKTYDSSVIDYLEQNNVECRVYHDTKGIMHQKIVLIDNNKVLLGSFNFQKKAQYNNSENFNLILSEDLNTLYKKSFNELWNNTEPSYSFGKNNRIADYLLNKLKIIIVNDLKIIFLALLLILTVSFYINIYLYRKYS